MAGQSLLEVPKAAIPVRWPTTRAMAVDPLPH